MENNLIKIMTDLQNKTFKVVRLTKTEFELDNGDVYPIPFELDLDEEISIEEFEKLCKHEVYAGKRVKRGLFKSDSGKTINADVNGSFNILRKVVHDFKWIEDLSVNPLKVNLS